MGGKEGTRSPRTYEALIAGAVAGTSVDTFFFPLDTIKTRLQSKQGFLAAGGFKGLFSGLSSAVLGSAPGAAAFFVTYEFFKSHLNTTLSKDARERNAPFIHMAAASAGEVAACFIRVPTEVKIWRDSYKSEAKPYVTAVFGSIAGGIAAALTTPLDVVKTRLMLSRKDGSEGYSGIASTFRKIVQEEGASALFRGLGPRVTWISLGGAVFLGMTEGFNGYALEFSPFFENKIAVFSAANFGIAGNGRLWVLNVEPTGIVVERVYDTQDGVFDGAWSEVHENQLVTATGDGSVKLWDLSLADFPVRNWQEHSREVFSVSWNLRKKDTFLTGSWDQTIKLWNPELPQSLRTFHEHTHCIYQTIWAPYSGEIFMSASGDQTVKLWDVRAPGSSSTIRAHQNEILALDWNKYDANCIATGSVDQTIKVWDLRYQNREVMVLRGHEYAVRRLKFSPHSGCIISSTSYDMTMRIWDTSRGQNDSLIHVHDMHTEFVLGVDMNMFVEGRVATCAWDETVHIMDVPALLKR
ncbi:hypothetical protein HDU97_000328 [Phlyctochytrium planicorne]|nr:hypothetical protein HDU97_000328 [Phlyctochytrium planicorne]